LFAAILGPPDVLETTVGERMERLFRAVAGRVFKVAYSPRGVRFGKSHLASPWKMSSAPDDFPGLLNDLAVDDASPNF
jgi:hypothetical protein